MKVVPAEEAATTHEGELGVRTGRRASVLVAVLFGAGAEVDRLVAGGGEETRQAAGGQLLWRQRGRSCEAGRTGRSSRRQQSEPGSRRTRQTRRRRPCLQDEENERQLIILRKSQGRRARTIAGRDGDDLGVVAVDELAALEIEVLHVLVADRPELVGRVVPRDLAAERRRRQPSSADWKGMGRRLVYRTRRRGSAAEDSAPEAGGRTHR
jgi:hypothetical protein